MPFATFSTFSTACVLQVFLYPLDGSSCVESGGESLEEALKRVHDRIDRLAMLSDFAIGKPQHDHKHFPWTKLHT